MEATKKIKKTLEELKAIELDSGVGQQAGS